MSSALDITYKTLKAKSKKPVVEGSLAASLLGADAYIGLGTQKLSWLNSVRYKTTSYLLGSMETKGEYKPNYLDYMQKLPGTEWKVTVPSVSPEQGPMGKRTAVTAGCTMDNQIAFDALSSAVKASEILGVDEAERKAMQQLISQIPPMQIGKYGQLQEWLVDADNPKNEHRHISHLYGLYPSNQISPFSHPELFRAAATTLKHRGDQATGWSLGWKTNFWARMLDGNHAPACGMVCIQGRHPPGYRKLWCGIGQKGRSERW